MMQLHNCAIVTLQAIEIYLLQLLRSSSSLQLFVSTNGCILVQLFGEYAVIQRDRAQ